MPSKRNSSCTFTCISFKKKKLFKSTSRILVLPSFYTNTEGVPALPYVKRGVRPTHQPSVTPLSVQDRCAVLGFEGLDDLHLTRSNSILMFALMFHVNS